MKEPQKIEISYKTIIFTVFFILGLFFLYLIRDIVLLLFIAILFMAAFNPVVTKLQKWHIPRGIGIMVVYLLSMGLVALAVASIVPPLVAQSANLVSRIPIPPSIANDIKNLNINFQDLQVIANQLNSVPKVFGVVTSAFSGLLVVVTVGVMSVYLLLERHRLHKHLVWLFGNNRAEENAEAFVAKVETQIGGWVRGEFLLMLVVGLMTYIGLIILKIDYALPLAILAGVLEILPNLGPTIAAIPAILVAYLTVSPAMALFVLALYILVQQLENHLIVPQIMRQSAGLNPIVTILLLMIGFRLGGVAGATLVIPLFLVLKVVIVEFYKLKMSAKVLGKNVKKGEFGDE